MGEIRSILETTDLLFVEWYVTCRPTGSSNSKNEDFMFGFKDIENGIESIKNIKIKNNEKKLTTKNIYCSGVVLAALRKYEQKEKQVWNYHFYFFFFKRNSD